MSHSPNDSSTYPVPHHLGWFPDNTVSWSSLVGGASHFDFLLQTLTIVLTVSYFFGQNQYTGMFSLSQSNSSCFLLHRLCPVSPYLFLFLSKHTHFYTTLWNTYLYRLYGFHMRLCNLYLKIYLQGNLLLFRLPGNWSPGNWVSKIIGVFHEFTHSADIYCVPDIC